MKITIRILGLVFMGLCSLLVIIHLLDLSIRKDEIDKISKQAMRGTQIIMQENIEDKYYGTNNARLIIESNEQYENLYKESLNKLHTSNGNYNLKIDSDYKKGLMSVEITYVYKNLLGKDVTLNKKLINIINVVVEE